MQLYPEGGSNEAKTQLTPKKIKTTLRTGLSTEERDYISMRQ